MKIFKIILFIIFVLMVLAAPEFLSSFRPSRSKIQAADHCGGGKVAGRNLRLQGHRTPFYLQKGIGPA